jgi:hypothetical protein
MMRALAAALMLCVLAWPAAAHKQSDAYLRLAPDGAAVAVQWDIALSDLDVAIGLDGDGDGAITWGEMRARHDAIAAYALARLTVSADGAACRFGPVTHRVDAHSDGAYAVLLFNTTCPAAPRDLVVGYRLLFEHDPQHRGLLAVTLPGGTRTAVLSPATPQAAIALDSAGGAVFAKFLAEGVEHILTGFDHLFFVAVLLLPAMLRRSGRSWAPVGSFREGLIGTVKVLSAFSAAHTITVALAALQLVQPPSRMIEAAIALTIGLSALDLVLPFLGSRRWLVAGSFGLIHGFGFAGALGPLQLPTFDLVVALFAFNLGVEAGQLLVAALVLPLTWALRHWQPYGRVVLPAGSAVAITVALLWFVERAFDLPTMPF